MHKDSFWNALCFMEAGQMIVNARKQHLLKPDIMIQNYNQDQQTKLFDFGTTKHDLMD